MSLKRSHRILGIVMLLPLLGWASTGVVFLTNPGYQAAYEKLAVKTYPYDSSVNVTPDPTWREFRFLKTILGDHLLVKTEQGWQQLNPQSLQQNALPTEEQITTLLHDAFTANPARYGELLEVDRLTAITTTGVTVTLDWNQLALSQKGNDTRLIKTLYNIHYLQWTGNPALNKVLGVAGIAFLFVLTLLGIRLTFRKSAL